MPIFEVRHSDLAARIGRIETPHGTFETPAFVPVVHPVKQTVSTAFLKKLGFECVITNAYITLRHYGDEARSRGIHDIIGYDGSVMTDSGGYQVLEYGSVEVDPETMALFERDIRSDIPIPLDKPTGYGLDHSKASEYVETTLANCRTTLDAVSPRSEGRDGAIWIGPVQGAEHSDLVERSAKALDQMGFSFLALGSPVEVMEAYEFAVLARMIATAKMSLSRGKPIHLFGAGHPLTISLAVALGCDTFDSASYMLYAKEGRYMLPNGTARIDDLSYLPCPCPVCNSYKAAELRGLPKDERTVEIAKHNLSVLKAEVDAVKQAIIDGRLWEYCMVKARAHPKLMEAVRLFQDFEFLAEGTALFKDKAVFLYEPIDQHRPEVRRFREAVARCAARGKKKLVLCPEGELHPFYSARIYAQLRRAYPDGQICSYSPFLGIIPAEISDVYPAAHNVAARSQYSASDFPTFADSLARYLDSNGFEEIVIAAERDDFLKQSIDLVLASKDNRIKVSQHER